MHLSQSYLYCQLNFDLGTPKRLKGLQKSRVNHHLKNHKRGSSKRKITGITYIHDTCTVIRNPSDGRKRIQCREKVEKDLSFIKSGAQTLRTCIFTFKHN